jgi:hypothetical protein
MAAAAAASSGDLSIKQQVYGKHPSGATVTLWTLDNAAPGGIQVQAIDYGQQNQRGRGGVPSDWQISHCLGAALLLWTS